MKLFKITIRLPMYPINCPKVLIEFCFYFTNKIWGKVLSYKIQRKNNDLVYRIFRIKSNTLTTNLSSNEKVLINLFSNSIPAFYYIGFAICGACFCLNKRWWVWLISAAFLLNLLKVLLFSWKYFLCIWRLYSKYHLKSAKLSAKIQQKINFSNLKFCFCKSNPMLVLFKI